VIVGSATLNVRTNGRIAVRTFSYFLATSLFNAFLGAILAIAIHPGDESIKTDLISFSMSGAVEDRKNTLLDNFLDLGRNIVPNNIFTAFFEQVIGAHELYPRLCRPFNLIEFHFVHFIDDNRV
jgi:solute carrier family 1 (high affinity glutamate transporter) protein 2